MDINTVIRTDPVLLAEYDRRQKAVRAWFDAQPRGPRAQCAFDLRTSPASLSGIIAGLAISESKLLRIERWMEEQEAVG